VALNASTSPTPGDQEAFVRGKKKKGLKKATEKEDVKGCHASQVGQKKR